MNQLDQFVALIRREFPDDRLTYQKGLPTFHPENALEAAQFIKLANREKQGVYITGYGNHIDPIGEPFRQLIVLRTDRLNYLKTIAPEDFYVTVGGGYPLKELNRELARHELFLPHAALPYVGSVGGAVAVNLTGRLGQTDVPLKKYLIKAELVTPEGGIIKPGSVCFKSVSGYDVVKLFASSWGLLGLVVEATFRVMPISGADDFVDWAMQPVDRSGLFSTLTDASPDTDAVYSQKIKAKLDPANILPLVP